MIEKTDDCPACGEIKRWLYDAQICAACGHGDRFAVPESSPDLVARLRAEEARMETLFTLIVGRRDLHPGTQAFRDLNDIKHALSGRDPVLLEAANALTELRATVARLYTERDVARANLAEAVEVVRKLVKRTPFLPAPGGINVFMSMEQIAEHRAFLSKHGASSNG